MVTYQDSLSIYRQSSIQV